ncbi:MAG: DUF1624 domain-containing protein [Melioribacteraceae bacterium]|nr:DUF1624 domain-containing protein [Melioribacteraceae bacterium]
MIKQERIIFIDLMRALAVLMMVQGHTIDAFLSDEYRTSDSLLYNFWVTMRGFTAPIFMISSGVAFSYLFNLSGKTFHENPRVIKGIQRFILLVLIAYLLRFPTHRVIEFSIVSFEQWMIFFQVDALHLIGTGILFLIFLSYISEKFKVNIYLVYSIAALFFFIMWNFTEQINWANFLPIPFAAWFYHKTGSLFPIFPWSGYVITGGILGVYLAKNPGIFKEKKFVLKLSGIGLLFLILALLTSFIQNKFFGYKYFITDNLFVIFLRLGVVLLLNSIMATISLFVDEIPEIIKQVGRYTLIIYAVHVIILYGSAWIPGFYMFWPKSLSLAGSILAAISLILLMILMVHLLEKYKFAFSKKLKNKKKPIEQTN